MHSSHSNIVTTLVHTHFDSFLSEKGISRCCNLCWASGRTDAVVGGMAGVLEDLQSSRFTGADIVGVVCIVFSAGPSGPTCGGHVIGHDWNSWGAPCHVCCQSFAAKYPFPCQPFDFPSSFGHHGLPHVCCFPDPSSFDHHGLPHFGCFPVPCFPQGCAFPLLASFHFPLGSLPVLFQLVGVCAPFVPFFDGGDVSYTQALPIFHAPLGIGPLSSDHVVNQTPF